MRRFLTLDTAIGAILLIFNTWFWCLSADFPTATQAFPRIFLAVSIALSILLIINEIRKISHDQRDNETRRTEMEKMIGDAVLAAQAYCFMVVYVLGIVYVGFFVSTTVFMLAFMHFLRVRRPIILISVTILMDAFLYGVFVIMLKLSLPAGILF